MSKTAMEKNLGAMAQVKSYFLVIFVVMLSNSIVMLYLLKNCYLSNSLLDQGIHSTESLTNPSTNSTNSTYIEEDLSIFVITNFYPFIEQQIDENFLQYRYDVLVNYTQKCLEFQYQNVTNFTWIITTREEFTKYFANFDYKYPHQIYINEYPERVTFQNDLYELSRNGKFRFLKNKLPHLTISLDSDDCMHTDYLRQMMDHVRQLRDQELVLYYTGSCYSYDPCSGLTMYHDRGSGTEGRGTENYSMGLSLLNNSTNNILNIALFGHGKPAIFFPDVGFKYDVFLLNLPGLYIQTTKSHSRGDQPDCVKRIYNPLLMYYGIMPSPGFGGETFENETSLYGRKEE